MNNYLCSLRLAFWRWHRKSRVKADQSWIFARLNEVPFPYFTERLLVVKIDGVREEWIKFHFKGDEDGTGSPLYLFLYELEFLILFQPVHAADN